MYNVIPIGDRIVIDLKKVKKEERTKGGLFLVQDPDKNEDKTTIGIVREVGDAVEKVKTGDKIIYEKYTGTRVTIPYSETDAIIDETNSREILVITESEVLAVLREVK